MSKDKEAQATGPIDILSQVDSALASFDKAHPEAPRAQFDASGRIEPYADPKVEAQVRSIVTGAQEVLANAGFTDLTRDSFKPVTAASEVERLVSTMNAQIHNSGLAEHVEGVVAELQGHHDNKMASNAPAADKPATPKI